MPLTEQVAQRAPPTPALVSDSASNGLAKQDADPASSPKEGTPDGYATEQRPPQIEASADDAAILRNLFILPPRQKDLSFRGSTLDAAGAIALPPLRPEEPVQSIRNALGEVKGYAHISNYRLVLEDRPTSVDEFVAAAKEKNGDASTISGAKPRETSPSGGGSKKKGKKKKGKGGLDSSSILPADIVSPFTGINSEVAIPASVRSLEDDPTGYTPFATIPPRQTDNDEIVLDDYSDLSPYMDHGLGSGNSSFRLVLERYDAAAVRDHVARLRMLLDGNSPHVTTLTEDNQEGPGASVTTHPGRTATGPEAEGKSSKDENTQTAEEDKSAKKAKEAKQMALAAMMPAIPLDGPVSVDGSNLSDFYYLACGEDEVLGESRGRNGKGNGEIISETGEGIHSIRRMAEMEARCRVRCRIEYGGFHPPPSHRRINGDIAYLEVTMPGKPGDIVHVTAFPSGFYVNKTSIASDEGGAPYVFDPNPADNPCYSHELLDCLLLHSKSLRAAWAEALIASNERAQLSASMAAKDSPLQNLFRVAVREDFGGKSTSNAQQNIDSLVLRPSWLVHKKPGTRDSRPAYNQTRANEEIASTFGVDVRGGSSRDWNDELQHARELPVSSLMERLERAKLVHKVLTEFGEASLVGAKAIVEGLVLPMNPNEPARSHVYLHNNIFFSRAVDAGVDTFKVTQGDRASRKSASNDANCMGTLHKYDIEGLHTLATVLIDFLGTRLVCQSIVPGILQGEKTHTLLYGAIEATSSLTWDKDMHNLLEEHIGKGLMVATRPMPTQPLSANRLDTIDKLRSTSLGYDEIKKRDESKVNEEEPLTSVCGPVEAKCIRGSDQRNYLLDVTRLTPRDANWVPKEEGGTGRWEDMASSSGKANKYIPESLVDDEHTMAVLRPELVTALTHKQMTKYLSDKKEREAMEAKTEGTPSEGDSSVSKENDREASAAPETDGSEDREAENQTKKQKKLDKEDEEYLQSLRLNVNVFLPNMKTLEGIDDKAHEQVKKDEMSVREASDFLWNHLLPTLTKDMRENAGHSLPVDGKALTELLHQRGINCRYLGRLATLAIEEEAKDVKAEEKFQSGSLKVLPRRTMPLSWLEMLECEMIARAAKHVLDAYLTENGGAAASQPAQTIACFLSAIMSTSEESAAETELRESKQESAANRGDFTASFKATVDGSLFGRSRLDIWEDLQLEIGRRFRYFLTLYNLPQNGRKRNGKRTDRALFAPLLRRMCQRNGIRLVAKKYSLGSKCMCSDTDSYPISPADIVDILPLVKHAACISGEGFSPSTFESGSGFPSLHILFPDAKSVYETAHAVWQAKALPQALDLFQEAASLYQRVVDTPLHINVAKCLEMSTAILFHAGDSVAAEATASRSLAVAVQLGGFDCAEAVTAHSTLSHILLNSNEVASGTKHLRASLYLTELMAGPHHPELCTSYHKLGSMYYEVGSPISALRLYQEAAARETGDRMIDGMTAKSSAHVLVSIGQYKAALDAERRAYNIYRGSLGEDHVVTKNSANQMAQFTKLAVEHGTRMAVEKKKQKEEQAANDIADQIVADEIAAAAKKKSKKKKRAKK